MKNKKIYLQNDHINNIYAEINFLRSELRLTKKLNKCNEEIYQKLQTKKNDLKSAVFYYLSDKNEDLDKLEYKASLLKLHPNDTIGLNTRLSKIDRTNINEVMLGIDLLKKTIKIYKN